MPMLGKQFASYIESTGAVNDVVVVAWQRVKEQMKRFGVLPSPVAKQLSLHNLHPVWPPFDARSSATVRIRVKLCPIVFLVSGDNAYDCYPLCSF